MVCRKSSAQYDFFASDLFSKRAKKGTGKLLQLGGFSPFEACRLQIFEAILIPAAFNAEASRALN